MNPPPDPHQLIAGNKRWAYTSLWQSHYYSAGDSPFLNYSICEPFATQRCLRELYDIPESACVLGRFGGFDTWNLPFANEVIHDILLRRDDIWFIFASTPNLINHERVIYLDPLITDDSRQEFINTCDAMLHCRWEGETFGLACAEFLASGKPIITWSQSRERNHILLADRACLFYHDQKSLFNLLESIGKPLLQQLSRLIPDNLIYNLSTRNTSVKLYKLALSL